MAVGIELGAHFDPGSSRTSARNANVVMKAQCRLSSVAAVSSPQSPRIVVAELTKHYARALALDHVSVTIEPGEFVAVIGRSGAGKTTLLRCLAGAVPVSASAIRVGGRDVGALTRAGLRAHRAGVGMVFQQFNLVKRLRVLDNVLVGRLPHLQGWRRWAALAWQFDTAQRDIALRCLAHVGLLECTWQRADTLSGGQQQRVAI